MVEFLLNHGILFEILFTKMCYQIQDMYMEQIHGILQD